MDAQYRPAELVEKKAAEKPRRRGRRRTYAELPAILRKHISDEYDLRGPDSDEFIARDCDVQRITVISARLHKVVRDQRRMWEELFNRGCSIAKRPIQREHGLEVVANPKRSA